MKFPFEVPFDRVLADLDAHVDRVFGSLHSEFLTMPQGSGFVQYSVFEQGYEALKRATGEFSNLDVDVIAPVVSSMPVALIVLRAILGFTPPEWAYVATQRGSAEIAQGAVRALDRVARLKPLTPIGTNARVTNRRIHALVATACELLNEGAPQEPGVLHRLDKADTRHGLASLRSLAKLGMPYAMVLYERFLGRPFASHRDSVSEIVGDVLENAIETILSDQGISFRKTKRAGRLPGFDQAPDFVVPDEFRPLVVIEAKVTEDDGTARDKVTRVQHLGTIAMEGRLPNEEPRFQVVACIAGRGFKVRREDMKKLLVSTQGKVFTLENLDKLVQCTRLAEFKAC